MFQSIKTYKGLTLEMALLSIPFVWLIALRKCAHSGTVGQRVAERDKTGRPKAAYKRVHIYRILRLNLGLKYCDDGKYLAADVVMRPPQHQNKPLQ